MFTGAYQIKKQLFIVLTKNVNVGLRVDKAEVADVLICDWNHDTSDEAPVCFLATKFSRSMVVTTVIWDK